MLNRTINILCGVVLAAALGFAQSPPPGASAAPVAKDQAEADLYNTILKETDPAKKMTLLDQWTEKYPDTSFKKARNLFYVQSYAALMQAAQAPAATPDQLASGEKAANTVIEKADTFFSPDIKLESVTDDQWSKAKSSTVETGHKTLAATALKKGDLPGAEAEYMKILAANPNDAGTAYLLGSAIVREKKVERIPEALFYFARADVITGPGALTPAGQKDVDAYLVKQYKNYHGDTTDLDKLKAAAQSSPTMPSDLKIASVTDISKNQIAQEEAELKSHPEIGTWRAIKASLTAPEGDDYFAKQMKGTTIPGLKGKVVAQNGTKELALSIDNLTPDTATVPEATLQFESPLRGQVAPGTELTFAGSPASYTKAPFMVTFSVEKKDVQGLGAAAGPAAPAHKGPVRRRPK